MKVLINIDSTQDPRLEDYTSLKDVALRRIFEPARGLYMAESSQVIARAVAAGHAPRSFLLAPRWLNDLAPTIAQAPGTNNMADGGPVPVFLAEENLLQEITGFHLHRGAMAAMHRPELPDPAKLLAGPGPKRVAILEDLVDHTNVGAAFRSAAAIGIDAVLVTPSCADPLYRRAVRVSMGTVFQIPWTRLNAWPDMQCLHEQGFVVAALALSEHAITLDQFVLLPTVNRPNSKVAVVVGTEGDGLSKTTLAAVDHEVIIPMKSGVDSLNVAAAAAVAFWALRP